MRADTRLDGLDAGRPAPFFATLLRLLLGIMTALAPSARPEIERVGVLGIADDAGRPAVPRACSAPPSSISPGSALASARRCPGGHSSFAALCRNGLPLRLTDHGGCTQALALRQASSGRSTALHVQVSKRQQAQSEETMT